MPPIRRARLLKRPLDILAPPAYYKNKKHLSGYTTISGANMRNFSDRSIIRRANIKLVELIVQTRYKEASVLFSEFLKTAKFSVADTWEAGAEILGRLAPHLLSDYLKAVYVYSPLQLTPVTFNAYTDQLMIEKKWATAMDEIELVYRRKNIDQPIFLRKLGVCAYRQWEEAKGALPKEYFQEDEEVEDSSAVTAYQRHTETAKKWLPVTCREYIRDPEMLEMYINFLTVNGEEEKKKKYILLALNEVKKVPEYCLLYFLIKINGKDVYFKSKPYITYLYESNPQLDSQHGLKNYVHKTCKQLKTLKRHDDSRKNQEKVLKFDERAFKLFQIFVYRTEHNNFELWFMEKVLQIFQYGMSSTMYDYWTSKCVEKLLSFKYLYKDDDERLAARHLLRDIKDLIHRQLEKNNIRPHE